MKQLSQFLNDRMIEDLRAAIKKGVFPEIKFEEAMQFILTDGVLPRSGLPVQSFLELEDWVRNSTIS